MCDWVIALYAAKELPWPRNCPVEWIEKASFFYVMEASPLILNVEVFCTPK